MALIALGGVGGSAFALDPAKLLTRCMLSSWEIVQGPPQNTVEDVAQTADGHPWLGTQEGLARFEGVR